ncbi:MAG TPA: polyprenyl synthetase family protein [Actinomycetota bacterium]|jgi:heptaprenyl diphosphate synthase|nr:polyprenyl synthetase family protein [Actinomycetota bacterium]
MTRATSPELEAPDPVLEAEVRRRLDEVEKALGDAVVSDVPLVSEAAGYLLSAGGKRFRPMLGVLAAQFGDPDDPRIVQGAVSVELTHMATLYHDDVIDEARSRRGIPSANSRWDNTVAILTGDFLFARAAAVASGLGQGVTRLLADTIARVCEGQIREADIAGRLDVDESGYMEVIRRKTASLISTSCRLGGILSGASPGVAELLGRFGEALGMAFQLSDDIMDLTADRQTLGKEPGADLREGVYTLPVIFALQDGRLAAELRSLLELGPPDDFRLPKVLELLTSDGGNLDRSRDAVSREVRLAKEEAAGLPSGTPRDALVHLAEFLATRCGAAV